MSSREWLIFCLRRKVWWAPRQAGYTEDVREAGRYSDAEALDIVERMNYTPDNDCQVKAVPANNHWIVNTLRRPHEHR